MELTKIINGAIFKKSSISGRDHFCVGVSMNSTSVQVTNLNNPGNIIEFTHNEWKAFIAGVKLGEFEVEI